MSTVNVRTIGDASTTEPSRAADLELWTPSVGKSRSAKLLVSEPSAPFEPQLVNAGVAAARCVEQAVER